MAERITQLEQAAGLSQPAETRQITPSSSISHSAVPSISHDISSLRSPVDTINSTSHRDTPQYTSTSALEDPVVAEQDERIAEATVTDQVMPSMNQDQLEYWENAASKTCSAILRLPTEKVEHLLKTHFNWIHPMFLFVPRVPFMRDAASGGRFFSELLLCVICLHATRFTDHSLSKELLGRVRLLLGHEIHRAPSVPTVQALLQLSAREMGKGLVSRAWLYSGMGFRMGVDLGIFTRSRARDVALDPELERVRQQIAWSSYVWDRIISLYLGRLPTIPDVPEFDPPIMDDISEDSMWLPYAEEARGWNPLPARIFSTFANFCKLVIIISDILTTVYARDRPSQIMDFVHATRARLEQWRAESPAYLHVDASAESCPPPHILAQSTLYYTSRILLHRPFRHDPQCQTICREAAQEVEDLILLLEKSFGLSHCTYLMSYSAYTAATVALQDLHDGLDGAQAKINTCLRALYAVRSSCPGIQTSINIVIRNLDRRPVAPKPQVEQQQQQFSSAIDTGPTYTFDGGWDELNPSVGDFSTLAFNGLDNFAYGFAADLDDNYLNAF
ncbi:Nitrogen assimilation transcription factor nit-4 [Cyphellophora attinorum]|uniref:Nitrogen assimilation transcription factor nit-4 n=1 Tax=Cyphellophora attinorum TaxID=1664694 RepID=A0A0N1HGE2_9EURO|nr:Nitrogen assimilation transcription factor nit-4 [Phialophora attinorum]KPI44682.1 Nitrogen assimilation transcription factor nit-4 [Phialophora attinorum]